MTDEVALRDVVDDDLAIFFEQQLDDEANHMAAFTRKDPTDRDGFMTHWAKVRGDETITIKTILLDGQVAGSVLSHGWFGEPEVSYWIGKAFWGRGVATQALSEFLRLVSVRPLHARVAKDNHGSIRVLEKCGFTVCGEDRGFANARGQEIEELIMKIDAAPPGGSKV